MNKNRKVVLASRPTGWVTEDNFRIEEAALPQPGAGEGVVGKSARPKVCGAVGLAGEKRKCDFVGKELGFPACVDYKAGALNDGLKAALPGGVDFYFENVGGEINRNSSRLNSSH